MKKLIIFAVIVAAVFHFKPELFSFSKGGAFDSDGNPQVWVFTFDGCGKACDAVLSMLDKRVEYMEFNVSEEPGRERLASINGGNNFPLTVIGDRRVVGSHRMHIVSGLAEVIGETALTTAEHRIFESHFYDDTTPAVVMYGASWCGYCKKMREYFAENNIQYTELNAEGEAKTDYAVLRGRGFPLIYIGYRRIDGANIKLFERTMKELNL